MTTHKEALTLLVEALSLYETSTDGLVNKALAAGKEALAQPAVSETHKQEPVAKYTGETWCGSVVNLYEDIPLNTLLYTTPPQRKPLTDEEIAQALKHYGDDIDPSHEFWRGIAKAIEAAHGIKE